jgi:hypothetical protein
MIIIVLTLGNILYVFASFVKSVRVVCRLLYEEKSDQKDVIIVLVLVVFQVLFYHEKWESDSHFSWYFV